LRHPASGGTSDAAGAAPGALLATRGIAFSAQANGATDPKWLARWCEEYFETYGGVEITADWGAPAEIKLQYLPLGAVALRAEQALSINGFHRHREHVARDGDDHFTLIINRGTRPTERSARSQSITLAVRAAILFDRSEESAHFCPGGSDRLVLIMPRRQTCAVLPRAEDLVGTVVPAGNEALRLLAHHADSLLDDAALSDPAVLTQAGQNLLDLTVLAFGTDRDNAEVARCRGLRAARLAAVLRCIRDRRGRKDLRSKWPVRTQGSLLFLPQLRNITVLGSRCPAGHLHPCGRSIRRPELPPTIGVHIRGVEAHLDAAAGWSETFSRCNHCRQLNPFFLQVR
jgi:hypothetical protein